MRREAILLATFLLAGIVEATASVRVKTTAAGDTLLFVVCDSLVTLKLHNLGPSSDTAGFLEDHPELSTQSSFNVIGDSFFVAELTEGATSDAAISVLRGDSRVAAVNPVLLRGVSTPVYMTDRVMVSLRPTATEDEFQEVSATLPVSYYNGDSPQQVSVRVISGSMDPS